MSNRDVAYRDFIYLDIDRLQSILAQLEQGLLTDLIAGRSKEVGGTANIAAGLLSQFLPLTVSAGGKISSDVRESKVLHDYAFTVALNSLRDRSLLLEATEFERDEFPVPENAFVLIHGSIQITDYEALRRLMKNWSVFERMSSKSDGNAGGNRSNSDDQPESGLNRRQRRALKRLGEFELSPSSQKGSENRSRDSTSNIEDLIEVFYGDMVQSIVTNIGGVRFVGVLNRDHLREDIRDLIFKYGSRPQGEWTILAQVTRIPEPEEAVTDPEVLSTVLDTTSFPITSVFGAFGQMLSVVNLFQEFMGSVNYPDVAVSPIALYRETLAM